MSSQFSIGCHRIDFYFLENKLTIECKKNYHKDRDLNYKTNQQMFIEDQLNYN